MFAFISKEQLDNNELPVAHGKHVIYAVVYNRKPPPMYIYIVCTTSIKVYTYIHVHNCDSDYVAEYIHCIHQHDTVLC